MKSPEKAVLVQNWLYFARENLLFAKAGMKEEFAPYHTVCFLCHGSAEKYLKAFLLWHGWELEKTHDLSKLLDLCLEYDSSFDGLFPEAELLNEYITEGRYPGDLPFEGIGEEDAKKAVEAAEKVAGHVMGKLNLLKES